MNEKHDTSGTPEDADFGTPEVLAEELKDISEPEEQEAEQAESAPPLAEIESALANFFFRSDR